MYVYMKFRKSDKCTYDIIFKEYIPKSGSPIRNLRKDFALQTVLKINLKLCASRSKHSLHIQLFNLLILHVCLSVTKYGQWKNAINIKLFLNNHLKKLIIFKNLNSKTVLYRNKY